MPKYNGVEYAFVNSYEEIETSIILPARLKLRQDPIDVNDIIESIRTKGLIEPIVVRPNGNRFEIVAGNRRFLACKKLNFRRIPAIVVELSDKDAYEASMVENIQRRTLNPIEEAECFVRYCRDFGWGSESTLAGRIGKSQEYVSHRMRLLSLPEEARNGIRKGAVSPSVGEEISWLENRTDQQKLFHLVRDQNLNRSETRKAVKLLRERKTTEAEASDWLPRNNPPEPRNNDLKLIERAILTMKISMVRLDCIIERAQNKNLRDVLLAKRISLHALLDELVRYKVGAVEPSDSRTIYESKK